MQPIKENGFIEDWIKEKKIKRSYFIGKRIQNVYEDYIDWCFGQNKNWCNREQFLKRICGNYKVQPIFRSKQQEALYFSGNVNIIRKPTEEELIIDEQIITRPKCVSCDKQFDEVCQCIECQDIYCDKCGDFDFVYGLCMDDKDTNDDGKYECGLTAGDHVPYGYICAYCR